MREVWELVRICAIIDFALLVVFVMALNECRCTQEERLKLAYATVAWTIGTFTLAGTVQFVTRFF